MREKWSQNNVEAKNTVVVVPDLAVVNVDVLAREVEAVSVECLLAVINIVKRQTRVGQLKVKKK